LGQNAFCKDYVENRRLQVLVYASSLLRLTLLQEGIMPKMPMALGAVAFGLLALPFAATNEAAAQSPDVQVCYVVKEYPPTRLVLNIKYHSRLPTTFAGGNQATWDADGKHAYTASGKNLMAVFDGAVVTSTGTRWQPRGSHLGGTSYFVRGGGGIGPSGGQQYPIFWECTSDEWRAAPDTFYCTIQSQAFARPLPATLEKSRVTRECDVFQDTED
jgi:hypothetical protein